MQVRVTLVNWAVLMLSLGQIVLWECRRRRNGPSLKPGHLDQLNSSLLSYSPPADPPSALLISVVEGIEVGALAPSAPNTRSIHGSA